VGGGATNCSAVNLSCEVWGPNDKKEKNWIPTAKNVQVGLRGVNWSAVQDQEKIIQGDTCTFKLADRKTPEKKKGDEATTGRSVTDEIAATTTDIGKEGTQIKSKQNTWPGNSTEWATPQQMAGVTGAPRLVSHR